MTSSIQNSNTSTRSLAPTREQLRQLSLSALATLGFFLIWELGCMAFHVSSLVLPKPSEIASVLWVKFPLLLPHATQTLYTTLVGFVAGVLGGIVLGALIGSSKLAYDVAYPLLVGFSCIPKVAVVPIFVVWFGSGTVPAILTSAVISVFPVVVNVATGLASTEPELEDVFKVLGASPWDLLINVGLPRTLPYLFASMKIAVTLSFVGTVLSETVAANKGIGNVMMIASGNFDVPLVFAGLFLLAIMGVVLYALFALMEFKLTGWAQRKNELAMA